MKNIHKINQIEHENIICFESFDVYNIWEAERSHWYKKVFDYKLSIKFLHFVSCFAGNSTTVGMLFTSQLTLTADSSWLTMSHPVLILAMPFGNNTISGGRRHWSPPCHASVCPSVLRTPSIPRPIDHRVVRLQISMYLILTN